MGVRALPPLHYLLYFLINLITISYNIIARQKALLTIRGAFFVRIPLIIQQRLPKLTKYFTRSAFFISIPAPLNTVAIHPIISAIIITNKYCRSGRIRTHTAWFWRPAGYQLQHTPKLIIFFL